MSTRQPSTPSPAPKLCTFCRYFELNIDGYDTSGYYAVVECRKSHWASTSGIPGYEDQRQAETCPDYTEAK